MRSTSGQTCVPGLPSEECRNHHSQFTPGVPVEVVPFAYAQVLRKLRDVLGSPNATLRMAKAKAGPVVTDNSNFVIDAPFSREIMKDPSTVREILPLPQACTNGNYCRFWQKSKCSQVSWKLVCSAIWLRPHTLVTRSVNAYLVYLYP